MPDAGLFDTFPEIRTARLHLRQIRAEDAQSLHAFYSDPEVMKHLDWNGTASVREAGELIDSWNRAFFDEKRLIPWGISTRDDDRLIGTAMLMPLRGTFETEPLYPLTIGFDLNRAFWSRGIMSEALRAVLAFGKERIGTHRIQAEVLPDNTASLALLEKLGFRKEGLLRQHLLHDVSRVFLDVVVMALLLS